MAKCTPKNKQKNRFGNRLTRKLLLILLLTMVLFATTVWGASARYVYHGVGTEGIVVASEFYFTSDYLTPEGAFYVLNPGNRQVTFHLRNYDGLNISGLPVTYTVSVNGEERTSGTIADGEAGEVAFTLPLLTPGASYNVVATGSNGYQRTLSASFTVKADAVGIYKHTQDCGDYVLLTIWTQGVAKNASLTVPEGLIPDYTDPNLHGKTTGNVIQANLGENQSISYRFFKTGGYGSGEIGVTSGGSNVPETDLN